MFLEANIVHIYRRFHLLSCELHIPAYSIMLHVHCHGKSFGISKWSVLGITLHFQPHKSKNVYKTAFDFCQHMWKVLTQNFQTQDPLGHWSSHPRGMLFYDFIDFSFWSHGVHTTCKYPGIGNAKTPKLYPKLHFSKTCNTIWNMQIWAVCGKGRVL